MVRQAQGVASVALALGLGVAATGAWSAPVALPRCPSGEGNPIAFTGPLRVAAGTPATMQVRADLSERIELEIVTASGKRVQSRSTENDVARVRLGGLAAGTYTLRVKAAFTYPVPETGELGLCVRVGGRVVTVRAR